VLVQGQKEQVIEIISDVLCAIDAYRHKVKISDDLGIEIDINNGYQPDLDDLMKRWRVDPVGQALREGIRKIGTLIAPHATFEELIEISESAANLSQNYDWSMAIINHMWDGLISSDGHTLRA